MVAMQKFCLESLENRMRKVKTNFSLREEKPNPSRALGKKIL
jgi:hypothetical protein